MTNQGRRKTKKERGRGKGREEGEEWKKAGGRNKMRRRPPLKQIL